MDDAGRLGVVVRILRSSKFSNLDRAKLVSWVLRDMGVPYHLALDAAAELVKKEERLDEIWKAHEPFPVLADSAA